MFVKGFSFTFNCYSKLMFFINRCNLNIVISIFIFTFYLINEVSIFNFHLTWLSFPDILN